MAAVNDSMKKTTVHEHNVVRVGGNNVYLDDNGNVVRVEKQNRKNAFNAATKNLKSQMANTNVAENDSRMAQMFAMQRENG